METIFILYSHIYRNVHVASLSSIGYSGNAKGMQPMQAFQALICMSLSVSLYKLLYHLI